MFILGDTNLSIDRIAPLLLLAFVTLTACSARHDGVEPTDDEGLVQDARSVPIDHHLQRSNADGSPGMSALESVEGDLNYRDGCLYLSRDGGEFGLIAPANATFDGEKLVYRNSSFLAGKRYRFSGDILGTDDRSNLSCKMQVVLEMAP